MCSLTNPRIIEAIRGPNFGRIETNKYLAITFCAINQDFDPCDITGTSLGSISYGPRFGLPVYGTFLNDDT